MGEIIAALTLYAATQALTAQVPDTLPGTAVAATVDDIGGPPTAPTISTLARSADPASVIVPVLSALGTGGIGFVAGWLSKKTVIALEEARR